MGPAAVERDGGNGQKAQNMRRCGKTERTRQSDLKHHGIERAANPAIEEGGAQRDGQGAENHSQQGRPYCQSPETAAGSGIQLRQEPYVDDGARRKQDTNIHPGFNEDRGDLHQFQCDKNSAHDQFATEKAKLPFIA
ncbi:hypothetical protein ACM258_09870 [Phaeobacter piscinae]|uniref:hypothetical protein n=1 Tax=Phaeobacter piscinae TaxID=1580596 RepID=UPI0039F73EDB